MSTSDPTDIKNVLAALDNSEMLRHWHKPPRNFGPDNPEFSEYNRNGLTDPGDLSMISFTEEYAFGESSSDEVDGNDEDDSQDNDDEVPFSHDLPSEIIISHSQEWMDPAEETREEDTVSSLQIAQRAHHQNLLLKRIEEMAIDDEYSKISQERTVKHYQNYMTRWRQIRKEFENQHEKYRMERDERLEMEEVRLRQQEEDASQTVKEREKEYIQYVRQRSSELNKLVEDAERREAEERNIIQGLVNELQATKSIYIEKDEQMKQLVKELKGEQTMHPYIETMRSETLNRVDSVLELAIKDHVTKIDLSNAKNSLLMNINEVDNIIQALLVKKEKEVQLESERANELAEKARQEEAAAKQRAEEERQLTGQQNEIIQNELTETSEDQQMIILNALNRKRYEELKLKMEDTVNAQNEMDNEKKKDIGRILAIINQLDGTNQNINRERLQKLLSFLGGRNVQHNNKKYCTENNPITTAYVKNRLISNIVKIGHDTYAKKAESSTCVAAYAWLVVSLVACYPDMWDIFLYHLYITCPYLIPLYIFKEDGQSDEDFDKARGMRQKEKSDSYFSRMGNAALLFGLVLTKMSKRSGMPEQAPIVGWKLLAGMLTLHPTPGVSAIVLEQFLNGAGADLQQTYGKQFTKLMDYVINIYLPRIEEVSVAGTGGQPSLNQLKMLLEDYKKTRKIKPNEYIDKFN